MEWTFLDTWIIITGALSAMSCALLGNYLVLRKMSMMGDAISHAVLPGLAIAFLITGSRDSLPMLLGATGIGILTAFLVQTIFRYGKLEEGAAMGVIFTTLFAIGLILIRQAADHVDLDPGCVLYGAIELTPLDTYTIGGFEIPRAAITGGGMLLINALFVVLFYKELKLSAFDPALATTLGISANLMHYLLMTLVAATTVAAFESVGSILVIAMLIVPPACAYLLTDRLGTMIFISLVMAAAMAVLGHISAITVPTWFGFRDTSTAGMMAVMAGLLFVATFLLAPRYGILSRLMHQALLSLKISRDDILGFLYRFNELARPDAGKAKIQYIKDAVRSGWQMRVALWDLKRRGHISIHGQELALTPAGTSHGRTLIRSHRLWETYLCDRMGICLADVHDQAHQLEHFTDRKMQSDLAQAAGNPSEDPHQKAIPDA